MPEDSELGVAFFGGEDEAHCVETMGLVLVAEQPDFATGKAAIQAAGGLVFFEGAQL